METCANCDRVIGKLEKPHVWQDQVVCASCHKTLSESGEPIAVAAEIYGEADFRDLSDQELAREARSNLSARSSRPSPLAGEIVCHNPNCGFVGRPTRKNRGSVIVAVFLLLVGVLPGLLYILAMSGYDYFCPRCHMKLRSEHR